MDANLSPEPVLLTGATGFLGQYLLRHLLHTRRNVAVIVRDSSRCPARERISRLVDAWSREEGKELPAPHVIIGDLSDPLLDISLADRHWLFRYQPAIIHSAASLSFRGLPDGEPWRTNFSGTLALAELARKAGIQHWHQISTAYVCGHRRGLIREEELDCNQQFSNPYEESKFAAERFLRRQPDLHLTVYRPSIIVGHSQTGETASYLGFYQFLEMASKLADPVSSQHKRNSPGRQRKSFSLRLPMTGEEELNLVPVDYVANIITRILDHPNCHGHTYHVVSRKPATMELLHATAIEELSLEGVELVGPSGQSGLSRLEELFWDGLREYLPYLDGTPRFCDQNTAKACPSLSPPPVDRGLLQRLIRYAQANNWGHKPTVATQAPDQSMSYCQTYFEEVFPRQARQSLLAKSVGLDKVIGFSITGPGGGEWNCSWRDGDFIDCKAGLSDEISLLYRMERNVFDTILAGTLTPQEAFFQNRITIQGDLETALKLAYLFNLFLQETRQEQQQIPEEIPHARAG